jgi:lysozyme family protein
MQESSGKRSVRTISTSMAFVGADWSVSRKIFRWRCRSLVRWFVVGLGEDVSRSHRLIRMAMELHNTDPHERRSPCVPRALQPWR